MKIKNLISYILSSAVIAAIVSVMAFADDIVPLLSRDYLTEKYLNEEEKLATMGVVDSETGERKPNFENDEYEIWALEETGEVGIRVKATGQILLTNPYNVGYSNANEDVKKRLLSQIVIQYKDSSGAVVNFCSYADAAQNSSKELNVVKKQIVVKNTRNGIRRRRRNRNHKSRRSSWPSLGRARSWRSVTTKGSCRLPCPASGRAAMRKWKKPWARIWRVMTGDIGWVLTPWSSPWTWRRGPLLPGKSFSTATFNRKTKMQAHKACACIFY